MAAVACMQTRFSEPDLLQACRAGDEAAMAQLYEVHKLRVYRVVARIVGSQDAEDVTQDVFVRVFRSISGFRGDAAISTWLYRMAVNASLTHVARRQKHRGSDEGLYEMPAQLGPSSDERVGLAIQRAMAALPAGYRAILTLHDVEDLTHEACAEILGCTVGTCKSQLHKARAKMRELLGEGFREVSQ